MDRQRTVAIVIDKAQLPELVHEMTDRRPGRADHLRQVFLSDSGKYSFGSALLAKMSQQLTEERIDVFTCREVPYALTIRSRR